MHLVHLRLRDFRNYARLDVDFSSGIHLFLGGNGQGKTNILEAIYLLATLRSFRGVGSSQMIRHGQTGYFVGANIAGRGECEVKMYWSTRERRLTVNGEPVRKLGDYWGTLRAVVFCSEDLQLVKGTGRARRRFLDFLLAQTYPTYLPLLQRYAQALRSRNALLKRHLVDANALDSFTAEVVKAGNEITQFRQQLVPHLAIIAQQCYHQISRAGEELMVAYRPSVKSDFLVQLHQSREREKSYGATLVGPHRDELDLLLNGRAASQFASEGQKRTLAIALKMAQAAYLLDAHGSPPILLIDDVMGELDASRRGAFVPLLERARAANGQVFMTATEENWPAELGATLCKWKIEVGKVGPLNSSPSGRCS